MKPSIEKVDHFPYPYYQYGSKNSTDIDVIIVLPKVEMPKTQEARKIKLKQLLLNFNLSWNAIFVVIEHGVLVDTIYTKSWIDSLNNAFYYTYKYHKQLFEIPIKRTLKRNKTLAIYKAVRTVLTMLTRTHLRTKIKPILKGIHPFNEKLNILKTIDFTRLDTFNQKNTEDEDIWKIIAFYIAQNELLLSDNIEVYSKDEAIEAFPLISNCILRKEVSIGDKKYLTELKDKWMSTILNYGVFISNQTLLSCKNETIDMVKEISI